MPHDVSNREGKIESKRPSHLPELKLSGDLELLEARVKVELEALRLREVGAVPLVAVLVQIGQMVAQDLTQAPELVRALVLQAEGECSVRRHLHSVQCTHRLDRCTREAMQRPDLTHC